MKNLILMVALIITSCSCGLTLKGSKSLAADVGFKVGKVDGWERIPNIVPIPLPSPSYGDITLYDRENETLLFISTLARVEEEGIKELFNSLGANSSKDPQKSNIISCPDIPGALEVSIRMGENEFRVVAVNSEDRTHLIQAMITKESGQKPVSDLLKAFKQ